MWRCFGTTRERDLMAPTKAGNEIQLDKWPSDRKVAVVKHLRRKAMKCSRRRPVCIAGNRVPEPVDAKRSAINLHTLGTNRVAEACTSPQGDRNGPVYSCRG